MASLNVPISPELANIVSLVDKNSVVYVDAPTGSGKSVGIPAALAILKYKVFVTTPTRTAAVSLYNYQSSIQNQLNGQNKNLVGYAAEGQIVYDNDTQIVYATSGHIRRKLLAYFTDNIAAPIDFCDVLMVDEIHSGSLDTTIILSLWEKAHKSGVKVPKLVIASATPVPINIQPPPKEYHITISHYLVPVIYLSKDVSEEESYEVAVEQAVKCNHEPVAKGHIIIFGPGAAEIETMTRLLSARVTDAVIIPAFGALKKEELDRIYAPTTNRKIIIATNIAEMSITISDVGFVIDTLLEKRAETSQSGGMRLETTYISQDSADQRKGRTGRTLPGVCYRMCTQSFFENLDKHRAPEVLRVPIYDAVMELMSRGLDPMEILSQAPPTKITQSIDLLKALDMVRYDGLGQAQITNLGRFAPEFPLSVRNAAFLYAWREDKRAPFVGIVIAALIDCYGPSYFWTPRRGNTVESREEEISYKNKYFDKYRGDNDLESVLKMWLDLYDAVIDPLDSGENVTKWSVKNSINNKKIHEVLGIIKQCLHKLQTLQSSVIVVGPFTVKGAVTAARPFLQKVYFDRVFVHDRDGVYFDSDRGRYRYSRDINSNEPQYLLGLTTAEISGARGVVRLINFGIDVTEPVKVVKVVKVVKPRTKPPRAKASASVDDTLNMLSSLSIGKNARNTVSRATPSRISTSKTSSTASNKTVDTSALDVSFTPYLSGGTVPYATLRTTNGVTVALWLKNHQAPYPLHKLTITPQEMLQKFNNLQTYNTPWDTAPFKLDRKRGDWPPTEFGYPGAPEQFISLTMTEQQYQDMDIIVDYFNEYSRLQCFRKPSTISPYTAWYEYGSYVSVAIDYLIKNEQDLNYTTLRHALYENYDTVVECPFGRPTFISGIFKMFAVDQPRVLDVGAGWGGALISARANNASYYYGVEPDPLSYVGLQDIINTLAPGLPYTVSTVGMPSPLPDVLFNYVHVSPPGYDYEIYNGPQSINRWKNEHEWYLGFLFPTIKLCWDHTATNGFFFLQSALADKIAPYIEVFCPQAYYCGPIGEKLYKMKATWVWLKLDDSIPLDNAAKLRQDQMKAEGRRRLSGYPELFREPVPLLIFDDALVQRLRGQSALTLLDSIV